MCSWLFLFLRSVWMSLMLLLTQRHWEGDWDYTDVNMSSRIRNGFKFYSVTSFDFVFCVFCKGRRKVCQNSYGLQLNLKTVSPIVLLEKKNELSGLHPQCTRTSCYNITSTTSNPKRIVPELIQQQSIPGRFVICKLQSSLAS